MPLPPLGSGGQARRTMWRESTKCKGARTNTSCRKNAQNTDRAPIAGMSSMARKKKKTSRTQLPDHGTCTCQCLTGLLQQYAEATWF